MPKKVKPIAKEDVVSIDYNSAEVPQNVRVLKPMVYMDGPAYCVLLGPDPATGVFGCGDTLKEALEDWDVNYKTYVSEHGKSSSREENSK
jgi:hypothetical protein